MASMLVTMLLVMLAITSTGAEATTLTTNLTVTYAGHSALHQALKVFEKGHHSPKKFSLDKSISTDVHNDNPPEPLYIVSPKEGGVYPVLFFVHGTMIRNEYYSDLFEHIASHGVIVLAPQLWSTPMFPPSQQEEIDMAASVINWLTSKLQGVLPTGVQADLTKLALSGHSRGGKTAFALALGNYSTPKLNLNVAALIGVDPVAGPSKDQRTKPHILTYTPNSFDLTVPVTIIGTGLGNQTKYFLVFPLGACAPNEVNHDEFFNECPKGTHFVIKDYGHMDMLNDNIPLLDPRAMPTQAAKLICESSSDGWWGGSKRIMRRTLGGLIVAFLDAYLGSDPRDYDTILANPSVAPANLYPVREKSLSKQAYAQIL